MADRDPPEFEGLPLMLTAEHIAELLNITRKAVYKMAERGEIPGVRKYGRRLRFRRDDIKIWLLGN